MRTQSKMDLRMKSKKINAANSLKLLSGLLLMSLITGCATTVIPTSYLEHRDAGPARDMATCWVKPGAKLSKFENILVEKFSTQSAIGLTPGVQPDIQSSQLRDLLVAELKARGKKAVKDEIDLPPNAPYLVIGGNFAQLNPGNRVLRYMVGFGAGRAWVDVEAKVTAKKKATEVPVAEFGVSAKKTAGVWGGDSDGFLDLCLRRIARVISNYIVNN